MQARLLATMGNCCNSKKVYVPRTEIDKRVRLRVLRLWAYLYCGCTDVLCVGLAVCAACLTHKCMFHRSLSMRCKSLMNARLPKPRGSTVPCRSSAWPCSFRKSGCVCSIVAAAGCQFTHQFSTAALVAHPTLLTAAHVGPRESGFP